MSDEKFTVWFQYPSGTRKEYLSEEQMRGEAERYGFDADEVVERGESFMWCEGVTPYDNPRALSDDIEGGCFRQDRDG